MNQLNVRRTTQHRFSVPPYEWCFANGDGSGAWNWSGRDWQMLSKTFLPSMEQVRGMLKEIRSELRWSRPMLAAVLGVPSKSLRSWEIGERNPCASARRLIQLIHMLMISPAQARSALDLLFSGKSEQDLVDLFKTGVERVTSPIPTKD
jgi:DNA-binding transcriptional regulator YiaG